MDNGEVGPNQHSKSMEENEYWASIRLLFDMKLKSLRIRCPHCGRVGLVTTKWVKGRNIKPICVLHRNNGQRFSECGIGHRYSERLRDTVDLSREDLVTLLTKAKTYVLFSGGADSLCTLLYLREICGNNGHGLTAVHIDTTAGFPEVTGYVKRICRRLKVPLKVVRPKRNYFDLAKRWGIPGFSARWCCKELKVKPVRDYLSAEPGPKVVVDGIRSAESALRSTYLPVWYHPTFRCLSVSPVLRWSNQQVRSYVEASGLPEGPAKEMGCSAECWCGAYKKRRDFEDLLRIHPDIFDKLVEVERAQRGRFTFIYENGRKVRLETLKRVNSPKAVPAASG